MRIFLAILGAVGILWPASAYANRLFTSGFETNNLLATEWSTNPAGAPAFDTGTVHSGTYSLRFTTAADQERIIRSLSANKTSGTLFYRFYVNFTTRPDATTIIFRDANSSGTASMEIRFVTSSNVLRLANVTTGTTQTGAQALSTGTWYRIEARHLLLDTGGEMELRLYLGDATSALETLSITNEDTLATNVLSIVYGTDTNSTSDFYLDDIAINDEAGTFQTSWPGPGKIALMKPASDDTVAWTKTGANCSATTNTDCVDDVPGVPDDASGYNTSSTANQEDRLNLTALPAELPANADMILMDVYDRWDGNGSTGTRQGRNLLWDEGGAQTNGVTHTRCDIAAGNWTISTTAQHLVFDLGVRTKANTNSFDLGYEPLNNAECRVTAIWANVEWLEAPAASPAVRRNPVVY